MCSLTTRVTLQIMTLNPEIRKWFEERQRRLNVVKTTHTPSGQTIDWIPIESQSPIKIAPPPPTPNLPPSINKESLARFELEDTAIEHGPAGTVPVLRKNLSILHDFRSINEYLSKRPNADPNPQGYWHIGSSQEAGPGGFQGCEAVINLWDPRIDNSNDHSLAQCFIGNYDDPEPLGSPPQTIEVGWTVDQRLNGDIQPHLFTFYTNNGYKVQGNNQGGYNQDVDGWVQIDSNIQPGAVVLPVALWAIHRDNMSFI